jgi:hypothetical protein
VFALSTFTPTQRFGYLMLLLLAAALVGDLVFLPALLVGPMGRLFSGKKGVKERRTIEQPQTSTDVPVDAHTPSPVPAPHYLPTPGRIPTPHASPANTRIDPPATASGS